MTHNLRKAFAITMLLQGASVAFAQARDVTASNENRKGSSSSGAQVSTAEVRTEGEREKAKNRGFNVGVIGNYTVANPSEINGGSNASFGTAQNPGGGGVLVQAPLMGMYSSIGAEAQYLVRSSGVAGQENFQMLHIPVIARVYPFRILSLGLGGYYSRVLTGRNASRVPSPALQFSDNDYGAVGVAGVDIPVGKAFGIIAEGRLTQSIASQVGDANTWNDRNLQGVAGVRLNLSEL